MAEIALGWLGWTEEQALKSDVNAIRIAYNGKIDMFCRIGYLQRKVPETAAETPSSPKVAKRELTMELFDALWG